MQITDTNRSGSPIPLSGPGTGQTHPSLRPGAPYDAATAPANRLAIGRQAALRVLASEVIQALGRELGASPRGLAAGASGYGSTDPGGLIAVAQALRGALGTGAAGQGDAVDALLAKVESALGRAGEALTALGTDTQTVAAATSEFRDRVGSLVGASASAPAAPDAAVTAVSARHVRKERGTIELVTQDGDVVRIRFRSREAERVSFAHVEAGGASATSTRVDAYSGTRIKVDVNGSLDAGELEAIQGFLGEVDKLADQFFSGDVEQAFALGAALQFNADEIARYSLKLSLSERYEAEGLRGLRHVATQAPSVASQQSPVAASPRPAVAASSLPAAPAPVDAADQAPQISVPPDAVSTQASPTATPSVAASHFGVLDTIQAFLKQVFDAADTPLGVSGFEVSWSAKIRLVAEAIAILQPPPPDATAGAALLGDVLASAGEQTSAAAGRPQPAAGLAV